MQDRLASLQELLAESPNDAFILFAIAKEYSINGDPNRAKSYYLRLKEAHPEYIGLYYHLGKLEQQSGSPQEAIRIFEEGMRVAKSIGDQHAWSELSAALMELRED